jgi:hypothetical protein
LSHFCLSFHFLFFYLLFLFSLPISFFFHDTVNTLFPCRMRRIFLAGDTELFRWIKHIRSTWNR